MIPTLSSKSINRPAQDGCGDVVPIARGHHIQGKTGPHLKTRSTMKQAAIQRAWQGPPQCRDCGIRDLVLFADLREEDFRLIHEPVDELELGVGDTLFRAGEKPGYVYTVRRGLIKLVQYLANGDQRIVRLLRQGDLAGIEALADQAYAHHAVVLESLMVCRIPVSTVHRLARDTPRLHKRLMERWQQILGRADLWLSELSTGPARTRVARLLIRLARCCDSDTFYLPSREDMGAMLGVTSETVSRTTAEFRREGLLTVLDNNRAAADIRGLQSIVHD